MHDLQKQLIVQKTQLGLFSKWMKEVRLEEIQKALSSVCEYDVTKFLGVIFEKRQEKVLIPIPDILKSYLNRKETSINEAKACLVSLYSFKICLNALRFGLIEPDWLMGESVYSLLKAKMGAIIFPADLVPINKSQSLSELLGVVSRRLLTIDTPCAINLQRESKLIEITDREDLFGVFINSMSSSWVIKFMFSQGFLGISVLTLIQLAINYKRLAPTLNWAIGVFGFLVFSVAAILFISSISGACRDLAEIDKARSGYLRYLPQWLTPQALQRINQQIIPQYLAVEYAETKRGKLSQMGGEGKLMLFLSEVRKKIQTVNPLLNEDELLELLQEALEQADSWVGLQEVLRQNTEENVLEGIDRVAGGRRSVSKKINELRRMIRSIASHISESQIRMLIIEGLNKSQDREQFQGLMMKRVQEMGLARKENFFDRIANIFMFMG